MHVRSSSLKGANPAELSSGIREEGLRLEQLEQAQRADQEWRPRRRAELKAEIDRLLDLHMSWRVVIPMVLLGNGIQWLLLTALGRLSLDVSSPLAKTVIDYAPLVLLFAANLWLLTVRQRPLRQELALLTVEKAGG